MANSQGNFVYRNLANATSILGVLPLVILFLDDGYRFLIPLILYNNVMDDLDGILAAKLNIRSRFGGDLDNTCDVVAHVILALAVGAHFGGLILAASTIAAGSIILRVTTRINPDTATGTGSPTNELMRHMLRPPAGRAVRPQARLHPDAGVSAAFGFDARSVPDTRPPQEPDQVGHHGRSGECSAGGGLGSCLSSHRSSRPPSWALTCTPLSREPFVGRSSGTARAYSGKLEPFWRCKSG